MVADPRPADIPSDISVSGSSFDQTRSTVQFRLSWRQPLASYGGVARYEVQVVTEVGVASGDSESGPQQTDVQSFTVSDN